MNKMPSSASLHFVERLWSSLAYVAADQISALYFDQMAFTQRAHTFVNGAQHARDLGLSRRRAAP